MKPVLNSRTTPYDVGDLIVYKRYQGYGDPLRFKIIELGTCRSHYEPCSGCGTGNIAYKVKRFRKRLGIRTISLCPMRYGTEEYVKWEPPVGGQT